MARPPFYIFILRDTGAAPLVVHPFRPGSPLYEAAEKAGGSVVLEGRFGSLPGSELLEGLRRSLDAALEKGFRSAALDRGFGLRVLATSLAFLVTYLLFSIVVRDPVPILDETVLGSLAAFGAWNYLARRRLSSPQSVGLLSSLRKALGSAYFSESSVAALAEAWLDEGRAAAAAGQGRFEAWLARKEAGLGLGQVEELSDLLLLLEAELGRPGLLGPERLEDFEARSRRLALRGGMLAGLRNSRLSTLALKARRVLTAAEEAEAAETGAAGAGQP